MATRRTLDAARARLDRALAPPHSRLVPFALDGVLVGQVTEDRAAHLATFGNVFRVDDSSIEFVPELASHEARTAAMHEVATKLAAQGLLTAWRDERYDVAGLFELERAAARYFGVRTYAAHANGLVRTNGGIMMWLARRSATKAIDPGMLDNLVGGGIASRMSVADTLVKEAWEEAGIPQEVAAAATLEGDVTLLREQYDGIQHETIFVHDLWLPPTFVPHNQDGEAVEHRCVPLAEVLPLIAMEDGPDQVTIDASLVIIDALARHGVIQ